MWLNLPLIKVVHEALTADVAKEKCKVRKELKLCVLALRSLQHLSFLCG